MSPDTLDSRFAALRARLADEAPPVRVDDAIARAIAARAARAAVSPAARWPWPRLLPVWAALAAAVVLVAFVAHRSLLAPGAPAPAVALSASDRAATWRGSPFIPLVSLAELEQASDTVIVTTTMPRMQLSDLGVPVDPAGAADAISAEFLVRNDGAVLAVRFDR
jgi:hypothetical protein